MSQKIVVFGSGRGSNFQSIYKKVQENALDVKFACVITNNTFSGIRQFAEEQEIKTLVIQENKFENATDYEKHLLSILQEEAPDLILLAGYMKKIPERIIRAFPNKIMNIHPALLPLFGGLGMYGEHVHQAVFDSGVKITGATVHFVSEKYDEGPIIMQQAVTLTGNEDPDDIAKKVLSIEHNLYYEALECVINKSYHITNNKVVINEKES